MRVALICNTMSAFPLLNWLDIQGVLVGVGIKEQKNDFSQDIAIVCKQKKHTVQVFKKDNLTSQLSLWIRGLRVDLVLVLGFPYKIPKEVLGLPKFGFFNIHFGKLPKYGGSFPVFWQIKNQEKEAVLTVHKMNEMYDSGEIAVEIPIAMNPNLTFGILDANFGFLTIQAVFQLLDNLLKNTLILKPQKHNNQIFLPKPTLKDLIIDWQKMDAYEILALIKATNPWNRGAIARINGIDIKIIEAKISTQQNKKVCEVFSLSQNGMEVGCFKNTALDIKIMYSPYGYLEGENMGIFGIKIGDLFEKIIF